MRTVNYKEKDYDQIFLEMMEDAYQYHLVSTDERFLDYIQNRQDIENNYCLFLSVYAFENNKIYEDMTKLYLSNDLEKAVGRDLDILGNKFGIPRPQARKSSVELTFYLSQAKNYDFHIPQGTIVTTNGGTAYYTVEDAYTDDEYRRLIRNWAYSHIKGTKEAYELFFAYYDGVDDYRLMPLWDGAGTLKIIVDPSNDWILNDIKNKLLQNVQLFDDDVRVVGATKREIDVHVNVNVDIDSVTYYGVEQRENIAERVANAIALYIDGGYRRNGMYHKGLGIGGDFIPFQAGMIIAQEVPEVKSVDFQDTIKNIDNTIYAYEFDTELIGNDKGYDESTKTLVGSLNREYTSPMLYIGQGYKFASDNNGFAISIIKDGETIMTRTEPSFVIGGEDLYGAYIHLKALKDGATLSKITIYETVSGSDDNSYNTHVNIGDEEIAVCGDVTITIQDGTANKSTSIVCY